MLDPVFISIGAMAIVISGTLIASMFVAKITRLRVSSARSDPSDFVNMMLLFQAMRDVLNDQKALARKFNESLDKKVALVRELVESAQTERDELRKAHEELARLLADSRPDFSAPRDRAPSLQTQAAPTDPTDLSDPTDPTDLSDTEDQTGAKLDVSSPAAETRPQPDPPPADTGTFNILPAEQYGDDVIDSWTGIDFGGDEPSNENFPIPPKMPEQSEDPSAARNAFRALLDLDPMPRPVSGEVGQPATGTSQFSGNGAKEMRPRLPYRDLTPVQRRVYEYSDVGMRVGDIAKELGVGKGEVRLILSLRKDR